MPKGPARKSRVRTSSSVVSVCHECGFRIELDVTFDACACSAWVWMTTQMDFHISELHDRTSDSMISRGKPEDRKHK